MTSAPAVIREQPSESGVEFDADRGWRLHPQVAVRPEPFGALLYHFGTRKLSFLKNRTILALIESLGDHDDVRSACRAAGIDDDGAGSLSECARHPHPLEDARSKMPRIPPPSRRNRDCPP